MGAQGGLSLPADQLVLVGVCHYCGEAISAEPVEDLPNGKGWQVAEAFSYVALRAHFAECPERPAAA